MWNITEKSNEEFVFGVNRGVFVSNLSYNPASAKYGASLVINFSNGQKDSIYEVTEVLVGDNGQKTSDITHPKMIESITNTAAKITDLLKCYVSSEEIKEAFSHFNADTTFNEFCNLVISMIKESEDYLNRKTIAVRCQYSWAIPKGASKADVGIPRDAKYGAVFSKDIEPVETWETVITKQGAYYKCQFVDKAGNVHPLSMIPCPKNFIDSREASTDLDDFGDF